MKGTQLLSAELPPSSVTTALVEPEPIGEALVADSREPGVAMENVGLESEGDRRAVAGADGQGKEFDHSGEHFPGGRVVSEEVVTLLEAKGMLRYRSEGDPFCFNCEDGGVLLQCDYCTRAFHVRCSGRDTLPMEEEVWLCAWCAELAWSKGVLGQ